MSYEEELLRDLAYSSEEEVDPNSLEVVQDYNSGDIDGLQDTEREPTEALEDTIDTIMSGQIFLQDHLSLLDISKLTNITKFLKIYNVIPELKARIGNLTVHKSTKDTGESQLFMKVNQLLHVINQEIEFVFKVIQFKYAVIFPEIGSIITNPIDYIKVVQAIKQDLINIKNYEQELSFLGKDKILVLIMSGLTNSKKSFKLNESDFNNILDNCEIIKDLKEIHLLLSDFIEGKLSDLTPNLNNLIGSVTTSQLLISCGSLVQLAATPSCNLASIGVKELSSKSKNLTSKSIQMGYLYDNDMIKYLPDDIIKPSLRILSGKVTLAARIDLSKSDPQGNLGKAFKNEVMDKINKLLTPPESKTDKALPVPMEFKSKKRGGRKVRKMKQRFQISELAKAQNKVEFGKAEDTIMDQFGNEIGFGIIKNRKIDINPNTNAKLSKALQHRLNSNTQETPQHLDSLFEIQHRSTNDLSDIILKNKWVDTKMKK